MQNAPQISSFNPTARTLMGPGPSDVYPRITDALARPTIGHLDPEFVGMMDETKKLLQYAFQTENELTITVSAPGSAGMETCFVNLIEAGEKVIICRNGVFGERMRQNVERIGAEAIMVDDPWGSAVDMEKLQAACQTHPDAVAVALVHAETSTGAESDVKTAAELAHGIDAVVIVDAVTSLGGSPLHVDEWEIDAIYSGTQKCLSCVPGLSPVSFSQRAVDKIKARTTPVQSWFLDLNLVMKYWDAPEGAPRVYHHTAPVNALYALHESLVILAEEGLDAAWSRHRHHHYALRAGLEAMGLEYICSENERLAQLNSVLIPAGVDDKQVRGRLLNEFNLEIGAGLGDFAGKAWRIGLMGCSAQAENVKFCLQSLGTVLAGLGVIDNANVGLDAAEAHYAG